MLGLKGSLSAAGLRAAVAEAASGQAAMWVSCRQGSGAQALGWPGVRQGRHSPAPRRHCNGALQLVHLGCRPCRRRHPRTPPLMPAHHAAASGRRLLARQPHCMPSPRSLGTLNRALGQSPGAAHCHRLHPQGLLGWIRNQLRFVSSWEAARTAILVCRETRRALLRGFRSPARVAFNDAHPCAAGW